MTFNYVNDLDRHQDAQRRSFEGITTGQETVGTSSGAFNGGTSLEVPPGSVVKVKNESSNPIYVGDSSVSTSNGYQVASGESVELPIDDVSKIHAVAGTTGNTVDWIVLTT